MIHFRVLLVLLLCSAGVSYGQTVATDSLQSMGLGDDSVLEWFEEKKGDKPPLVMVDGVKVLPGSIKKLADIAEILVIIKKKGKKDQLVMLEDVNALAFFGGLGPKSVVLITTKAAALRKGKPLPQTVRN